MALLKKGSKGKEVEKLQEKLNKFGVSPKLKVDGIFGPKTDKAVRQAQTKLKAEKVDGKAGEKTMAALDYGKPLPKWDLSDFSADAKTLIIARKHNEAAHQRYAQMGKQVDWLDKVFEARIPKMKNLLDQSKQAHSALVDAGTAFAKDQAEFEKCRLKNPAKAEKLKKGVASDEATYIKLWNAFHDNANQRASEALAIRAELKAAMGKIESLLDEQLNAAEKAIKASKV